MELKTLASNPTNPTLNIYNFDQREISSLLTSDGTSPKGDAVLARPTLSPPIPELISFPAPSSGARVLKSRSLNWPTGPGRASAFSWCISAVVRSSGRWDIPTRREYRDCPTSSSPSLIASSAVPARTIVCLSSSNVVHGIESDQVIPPPVEDDGDRWASPAGSGRLPDTATRARIIKRLPPFSMVWSYLIEIV